MSNNHESITDIDSQTTFGNNKAKPWYLTLVLAFSIVSLALILMGCDSSQEMSDNTESITDSTADIFEAATGSRRDAVTEIRLADPEGKNYLSLFFVSDVRKSISELKYFDGSQVKWSHDGKAETGPKGKWNNKSSGKTFHIARPTDRGRNSDPSTSYEIVLILDRDVSSWEDLSEAKITKVVKADFGEEGNVDINKNWRMTLPKTIPLEPRMKSKDLKTTKSQPLPTPTPIPPTLLLSFGGKAWSSPGPDGKFHKDGIMGIAVDGDGNIYVTDRGSHRIQKFSPSGDFLLKWGELTCQNFSYVGMGHCEDLEAPLDPLYLRIPAGIAVDGDGSVYVTHGKPPVSNWLNEIDFPGAPPVKTFTSTGDFLHQWGDPAIKTGNNSNWGHMGIAVGSSGNVYVVNRSENKIQKFTSSGEFLLEWGLYDDPTKNEYHWPIGIALDVDENVYVTDYSKDTIEKFTSSGDFIFRWGQGMLSYHEGLVRDPIGIAVDIEGNIYLGHSYTGSSSRITKYTSEGQFVLYLYASPYAVATDTSGNLYFQDQSNSGEIHKYQINY